MPATYRLTIGRKSFPVASLAEASVRYQRFRGMKSSDHVPEGVVLDDAGMAIAKISYNGRVWPPTKWYSGMTPIMEAVETDGTV